MMSKRYVKTDGAIIHLLLAYAGGTNYIIATSMVISPPEGRKEVLLRCYTAVPLFVSFVFKTRCLIAASMFSSCFMILFLWTLAIKAGMVFIAAFCCLVANADEQTYQQVLRARVTDAFMAQLSGKPKTHMNRC